MISTVDFSPERGWLTSNGFYVFFVIIGTAWSTYFGSLRTVNAIVITLSN